LICGKTVMLRTFKSLVSPRGGANAVPYEICENLRCGKTVKMIKVQNFVCV
jgi:hypothetical protein